MKIKILLSFMLIKIFFNSFAGREYVAYSIISLNNHGICNMPAALKDIPTFNPQTLLLSNNKLKKLEELLRLDEKFNTLKFIDLSSNKITNLENVDFYEIAQKFPFLQILNLSNNNLNTNSVLKLTFFKQNSPFIINSDCNTTDFYSDDSQDEEILLLSDQDDYSSQEE